MTKEFNTKPGAYVLYYQNKKYRGTQIENYCKNNTYVEYVPGIYFTITENKICGIKKYMIHFFRLCKRKLRLLENIEIRLQKKWKTHHIEVTFKNIRDEYSLCTIVDAEEITVYSNGKFNKNKCFPNFSKYTLTDNKPLYTTVNSSEILFPKSSGGDGNRCFLKGILGHIGIFSPIYENEYSFLSEYEMHCAADKSDLLKQLCMKTPNCRDTVQRMKEGTYVEDHLDALKLSKYGDKYIVNNGNHRTCCAKLFGIEKVSSYVYYYEETTNNMEPYRLEKPNDSHHKSDNEKVLKTFYQVFEKNGLSEKDAKTYLEKDGSDIGLIMLFKDTLSKFC